MATLVDVVKLFIQHTGRVDLVNDFYADDLDEDQTDGPGARFYIKQASDFLDEQQETPQSRAIHVQPVVAGDYLIDLERCRAVEKVFFKKPGSDRVEIEGPVNFNYLRTALYTDKLEDVTEGTPAYWSIATARQAPEQFDDTLNTTDAEYLFDGLSEDKTRIVVMPPSDEAGVFTVQGLFYSTTLDTDTSKNWWTVNKPWIVVWTAKYILEGALRSSEGMRDLLAFLQPYLESTDKDLVEQQLVNVDQMEG